MPCTAAEGTRDVGASSLSLPAPTPDQHNRQPASSNQEMHDAMARRARIASGIDNRELTEAARDAQRGTTRTLRCGSTAMMFAACEANGTPIDTFLPPPGMETLLRERLGTRHGLLEQGPRDGGDPEEAI
ncbi:hypothetical protein VD0004_g2238 [Verticillium dahliae]|nr:hypothetical protein VD0004_g2238 [Verticillium dahliae]PNH75241.1 hypothetical protein VD0001_g2310 [Verticillium dahliae]